MFQAAVENLTILILFCFFLNVHRDLFLLKLDFFPLHLLSLSEVRLVFLLILRFLSFFFRFKQLPFPPISTFAWDNGPLQAGPLSMCFVAVWCASIFSTSPGYPPPPPAHRHPLAVGANTPPPPQSCPPVRWGRHFGLAWRWPPLTTR